MQVEIKQGGDGVACWNAEAIEAYATSISAREAALADANPDLIVTPARIKCFGCEVLEFDMGTRCTAELTHPIYAIEGEVAPRSADAAGSLGDVPGLLTRLDAENAVVQEPEIYEAAPVETAPPRKGGLLGLLGRRG